MYILLEDEHPKSVIIDGKVVFQRELVKFTGLIIY
jgi:hypothetical protein